MGKRLFIMSGLVCTWIVLAGIGFAQDHSQHGSGHATHQAATKSSAESSGTSTDPMLEQKLIKGHEAKTWETRGRLKAKEAELDLLLMAEKPDTAAVKKTIGEINSLKGKLFEEEVLFRMDYKKQTGKDVSLAAGMGKGGGGMKGMKGGKGKMGGKGKGKMGGGKCKMMQSAGSESGTDPHANH
ncbi:MAG: hypothetical protein ACOC0K_01760 [bacterium]